MRLNSIDLDRNRKHERSSIASEIMHCSALLSLQIERSPSGRGWHYTFFCNRECGKCRKKYDDPLRYDADKTRPTESQNVLFERKSRYYPKRGVVIHSVKGEKTVTEKIKNFAG